MPVVTNPCFFFSGRIVTVLTVPYIHVLVAKPFKIIYRRVIIRLALGYTCCLAALTGTSWFIGHRVAHEDDEIGRVCLSTLFSFKR